jgi:RNA polymerase sigma-70 factor, ECF subfamily
VRLTSAPDTEAIWREFHDGLLAFIMRRVRSPDIAEDILQEVMLRIHCHAAQLERPGAVGPWVHRIASNAIADHYRHQSVHRELAAGIVVDPQHAFEPGVESPGVRAELAACISPMLERLPEIYRQAVILSELEGVSQAEAAARVGLSVSGMKSRVQRARRQLKEVVLQCCEVQLDSRGDITRFRQRDHTCECSDCA